MPLQKLVDPLPHLTLQHSALQHLVGHFNNRLGQNIVPVSGPLFWKKAK